MCNINWVRSLQKYIKIEKDFNNSNQNFHNIFEMCIGQKTSLKFMDSRGEDLMRPKDQN